MVKKTSFFILPYSLFFLYGFSFTTIHESQDCRERGRHFLNSSLPLPPALQTLRKKPLDYYRELTSTHSSQLNLNREHLVSERKSLTTEIRAPTRLTYNLLFFNHSINSLINLKMYRPLPTLSGEKKPSIKLTGLNC